MKACPFCAEEIQDAATVCKHCGRDIPATLARKRLGRVAKRIGVGVIVLIALAASVFAVEFVRVLTAPAPITTNVIHGLLLRDADPAQRLGLIVREHQGACSNPTGGFLQGTHADGNAFWDVRCVGDGDYIVEIKPDDSAAIFPCGVETAAIMKTSCFRKF